MASQAYRLTFVLRVAGSEADTTQQTVTVATETVEEAVELARFYRAGLLGEAVVSATLTDAAGAVIWSEQGGGMPDVGPLKKDQP